MMNWVGVRLDIDGLFVGAWCALHAWLFKSHKSTSLSLSPHYFLIYTLLCDACLNCLHLSADWHQSEGFDIHACRVAKCPANKALFISSSKACVLPVPSVISNSTMYLDILNKSTAQQSRFISYSVRIRYRSSFWGLFDEYQTKLRFRSFW